jgi:hypothetical protein
LQRVLTSVTLLGLLVATAAAFAITEHLKLEKSAVYGLQVSKYLSPVCGRDCTTSTATIQVKLRHPDHVTVTIADADGNEVATALPAKRKNHFVWDGTTNDGTQAPDGVYHPWIYLAHEGHTYKLANPIIVDTQPPKVISADTRKQNPVFLAGPRRSIAIKYDFSENAHALVYLGRRLVVKGRKTKPQYKVKWAGTRGGNPVPAGTYVLSIGARDIFGNETPAAERKDVTVVVRYIELSSQRITVGRGGRIVVHVDTAARRYTYRLGKRHGDRRRKSLRLRAPTTPGTYHLVVAENGHTATAVVKVRRK